MHATPLRSAALSLPIAIGLIVASPATAPRRAVQTPAPSDTGAVTRGLATDLRSGSPTAGCTTPGLGLQPRVFPANIGTVRSADGRSWTVPAPIHEGPVAVDLFNNCTGPGDNPDYASKLETVVIDPDGVEITGFIFADNYFELYVNGRFIARDALAMVPFNSSVVRFRARYPMTYAIKGVDWENHQGVGMEYDNFQIGDGGFIAYFSDGNGTGPHWRAETFYIAPLDDPGCVRTAGGRDSSGCSQAVRPTCAEKDPKSCQALHFEMPPDWSAPGFDDSRWPSAIVWPPSAVTTQRAYTAYAKVFGDAQFIWTRNLRLDNLVLARFTVKGPGR
jgi:hypothetical protein